MRMLSFYENRAGKNLSAERKQTMEKAKDILREKEGKAPAGKRSRSVQAKNGSKSRTSLRSSSSGSHSQRSSGKAGS
jgi:hypothetical protein